MSKFVQEKMNGTRQPAFRSKRAGHMASFTVNMAYAFPDIQQAASAGDSADSDHHRGRNLELGVNRVDPVQSILLLAVFLAGALVLLHDIGKGIINPVFSIINRAIDSPWDLNAFLHLESDQLESNQYFSFAEEAVVSMGHRYSGRFDQAVLGFDGVPILKAIIERKFPSRNMPKIVRTEDMFQAGLYALALMERGVSCSSTRLVVIYCTQRAASNCVHEGKGVNCFECKKGRVFQEEFSPKKVLKTLKRLDEVWYERRKPRPSPEVGKCKACPFGTDGVCNHSAA